jgi:putative redox protein
MSEPTPQAGAAVPKTVVVESAGGEYLQRIAAGRHVMAADEPVAAGGGDAGPTPYDLLLSALGACVSMTLGIYARRKGWPLEGVRVRMRHSRVHAADCAGCETASGAMLDRIDEEIELAGPLETAQRERLLEIAGRCPVNRTLTGKIEIRSALVPPAAP